MPKHQDLVEEFFAMTCLFADHSFTITVLDHQDFKMSSLTYFSFLTFSARFFPQRHPSVPPAVPAQAPAADRHGPPGRLAPGGPGRRLQHQGLPGGPQEGPLRLPPDGGGRRPLRGQGRQRGGAVGLGGRHRGRGEERGRRHHRLL